VLKEYGLVASVYNAQDWLGNWVQTSLATKVGVKASIKDSAFTGVKAVPSACKHAYALTVKADYQTEAYQCLSTHPMLRDAIAASIACRDSGSVKSAPETAVKAPKVRKGTVVLPESTTATESAPSESESIPLTESAPTVNMCDVHNMAHVNGECPICTADALRESLA
jgi:hypothetical protein